RPKPSDPCEIPTSSKARGSLLASLSLATTPRYLHRPPLASCCAVAVISSQIGHEHSEAFIKQPHRTTPCSIASVQPVKMQHTPTGSLSSKPAQCSPAIGHNNHTYTNQARNSL